MTALLDWPPASVRLLSSGPVIPHKTCHVLSQLRAADEKIGQPDVVAVVGFCQPVRAAGVEPGGSCDDEGRRRVPLILTAACTYRQRRHDH